jgi:hypothetical protein
LEYGLGIGLEMLPYYENKVYINPYQKDKWGQPVLAIDCESKEQKQNAGEYDEWYCQNAGSFQN